MSANAVLIHGATGRTGRVIARQLCDAGVCVILAGRDEAGLRTLAASLPGVDAVRVVDAGSMAASRAAMRGCRVVVQCAALDEASVHGLVAAAIAAGSDYVDVGAERHKADAIARVHDRDARRRGVALCCGVAPIGGALGEWLGLAAARRALARRVEPEDLEALIVAYASDGLPPSLGSWSSSLAMLRRRPAAGWSLRAIEFPPPFGRTTAFAFGLGGGRALEARYPAAEHGTFAAFDLARSPASLLTILRGREHEATELWLAAVAHARVGPKVTSVGFSGKAPYRMTASMVALVVGRLLAARDRHGVVTPSELVSADAALGALAGAYGRLFVVD